MAIRWFQCMILTGFFCLGVTGCIHFENGMPVLEKKKDILEEVPTIGDLTEVAGVQPIQISGIGLVTGLNGTGGNAPPGNLRTMLENDLRKRKVSNVAQVLSSPDTAMVVVTAYIPPGARKGDLLDVEVTLPPGSKVTSLQGGYLEDCYLYNYESSKKIAPNYNGREKMLRGHALGKAGGVLTVGLERGAEDRPNVRKAVIWDGAIANAANPFLFTLKSNQQYITRMANAVAERINTMFQDEAYQEMQREKLQRLALIGQIKDKINSRRAEIGSLEVAKATKHFVYINVPLEYRLNTPRYLRVVRLIPIRETEKTAEAYRKKLEELLLDPRETLRGSHRLEALGRNSVLTLKKGLNHEHPLVQFAAAESLAYLGDSSGVPTLAKFAEKHPRLRSYCLTALSSLDEPLTRQELAQLLRSENSEVRYGAFRALQVLNGETQIAKGNFINQSFWLHHVAEESPSLVHMSLQRKAEIVIFGQTPHLLPPFRILAGKEFTVTASAQDDRCTVSLFDRDSGQVAQRQTGLKVDEVLRTLGELGASYPDVVAFLQECDRTKCTTAQVRINAVPQPTDIEELVRAGGDGSFLTGDTTPSENGIVESDNQIRQATFTTNQKD